VVLFVADLGSFSSFSFNGMSFTTATPRCRCRCASSIVWLTASVYPVSHITAEAFAEGSIGSCATWLGCDPGWALSRETSHFRSAEEAPPSIALATAARKPDTFPSSGGATAPSWERIIIRPRSGVPPRPTAGARFSSSTASVSAAPRSGFGVGWESLSPEMTGGRLCCSQELSHLGLSDPTSSTRTSASSGNRSKTTRQYCTAASESTARPVCSTNPAIKPGFASEPTSRARVIQASCKAHGQAFQHHTVLIHHNLLWPPAVNKQAPPPCGAQTSSHHTGNSKRF